MSFWNPQLLFKLSTPRVFHSDLKSQFNGVTLVHSFVAWEWEFGPAILQFAGSSHPLAIWVPKALIVLWVDFPILIWVCFVTLLWFEKVTVMPSPWFPNFVQHCLGSHSASALWLTQVQFEIVSFRLRDDLSKPSFQFLLLRQESQARVCAFHRAQKFSDSNSTPLFKETKFLQIYRESKLQAFYSQEVSILTRLLATQSFAVLLLGYQLRLLLKAKVFFHQLSPMPDP